MANHSSDQSTGMHKGLVAATVTPMHKDGSLNLDAIPKYIDHLISTGVKAIFLNGTTGEWCSLSCEERKILAETWVKHGQHKLERIIIHCGALAITESKDLVNHAAQVGAHAVACIAPSFLKPSNEEYLVSYLAEVASVAPNVPLLYYHIPFLTGVHINMKKFLTLASEKIPNFSGLKATTLDLHELYECLTFSGRDLSIYYGFDHQLLPALVMGARGAVGCLYNFLGTQFNNIIDNFNNGNLEAAREEQINLSLDIQKLKEEYGNDIIKLLTSLISGTEMGPNRLPMKNDFTDLEIKTIRSVLIKKGYLI